VIEVLDELIVEHVSPLYMRSDNGPEFIAYALQDHLKNKESILITLNQAPHGSSHTWSFHDKLRDELLSREIFYRLEEAKIIL
jgi:putative transposase